METVRGFRRVCIRGTLLSTAVAAAVSVPFSLNVALGVTAGGLGGAAVFALKARALERLVRTAGGGQASRFVRWSLVGWLVYAAVLLGAFRLDPEGLAPFAAAAAGLLIVRLVMLAVGVTSMDLRRRGQTAPAEAAGDDTIR